MAYQHATLFVGALDPAITEAQLAEIFQPFGPVRLVKIPMGKNCAFIEYVGPESCEPAIAALNGAQVGNGRIRVMMGANKGRSFGGVGGGGGYGGAPPQQTHHQQQQQPWQGHAAAASAPSAAYGGAAFAASAAHSHSFVAGGGDPSDPNRIYTHDIDDSIPAPSSYAPTEPFDTNRRNNAYAKANSDARIGQIGWQMQFVEQI